MVLFNELRKLDLADYIQSDIQQKHECRNDLVSWDFYIQRLQIFEEKIWWIETEADGIKRSKGVDLISVYKYGRATC